MKTLIFLWGKTSEQLNLVVDNFKKVFSDSEIDFGISTWDNQHFDESLFKYVIKTEEPTQDFLDKIKFPYTLQIKNVPEWHNIRFGHYSQFYHNFKISEFLASNVFNYDVFGKSRADLIFETNYKFDFTRNICFLPEIYWASKGVGINDHFICGKYEYLKKCLFMDKFESFFSTIENSWNPETIHQKLISNNQGSYVEFDCQSYKLLPDRKML